MAPKVTKEAGTDTPLRVAARTKDRVRWVAGLVAIGQGDVVEIAMREYIDKHGQTLNRLTSQLADPKGDEQQVFALRQELIPQPS